MAAGKYNLLIEQGSTFKKIIKLKSADNVPTNLTGAVITAYLKNRLSDSTPIVAFTVVLEDALLGKFSINLTAVQTDALTFKTGVYDIEVNIGGIITRVLEGNVVLSKGVTQ